MRGITLQVGVLLPFLVPAFGQTQQSFQRPPLLSDNNFATSWTSPPPRNATHHLFFDTISTLLTHWTHTRYRNGHTVALASIPTGTLLYHATGEDIIPDYPEWLATDWDHSMLFCRQMGFRRPPPPPDKATTSRNSDPAKPCHHLTVKTIRPLQLLYFDGSSAAKMSKGPMDTQDLVAWGAPDDSRVNDERARIHDLCARAKEKGWLVDGFVRMEMDFEVMLCGFDEEHGVAVVSFLPHPVVIPPPSKSADKRIFSATLRVIEAGSWHDNLPGDTRIQIDYSRFISFYDTHLFPSLIPTRTNASNTRFDYRAGLISPLERAVFEKKLKELVTSAPSQSGVDWKTLLHGVRKRNVGRLETLAYTLQNKHENEDLHLVAVEGHVRSMLIPFILPDARPMRSWDGSVSSSESGDKLDWAKETHRLCSKTLTEPFRSPPLSDQLSYSERALVDAVEGVQGEICRVLVIVWAEAALVNHDLTRGGKLSPVVWEETRERWLGLVRSLMEWLDWSDLSKCDPQCTFEVCFPSLRQFKRKGTNHNVGVLLHAYVAVFLGASSR